MTRLRAQDYFAMAESYAAAVERLAPLADEVRAPFHMLVAHALELSFKSVLSHAGDDEAWLMALGHDLAVCRRRAIAQGLTGNAAAEVAALVLRLDAPHRDQRYRYPGFEGGFLDLPPSDVAACLRRHLQDVRDFLDRA
jgi:hypothetical protein